MKKILAVFLAVLMAFSVFSVAVMADDEDPAEPSSTVIEIEVTENPNEPTTRNIVSESRWFSAFLDGNGAIRMLNLSNMNETNE